MGLLDTCGARYLRAYAWPGMRAWCETSRAVDIFVILGGGTPASTRLFGQGFRVQGLGVPYNGPLGPLGAQGARRVGFRDPQLETLGQRALAVRRECGLGRMFGLGRAVDMTLGLYVWLDTCGVRHL